MRECKVCGTSFKPVRGKASKFCSLPCYRVEQRRGTYKTPLRSKKNAFKCSICSTWAVRSFATDKNGDTCKNRYCSRACSDAAWRKGYDKTCVGCGMEFRSQSEATKFCNMACRRLHKKPKPKNCVRCGCLFSSVKFFKVRNSFAATTSGKTCSHDCHIAWISENLERKDKISAAFTGDKHPAWKGVNSRDRRGFGWKRIRLDIRKRDGHKCTNCGVPEDGKAHDVHHIIPFHNFLDSKIANRPSNLTTLCRSCHMRTEAMIEEKQMVLSL